MWIVLKGAIVHVLKGATLIKGAIVLKGAIVHVLKGATLIKGAIVLKGAIVQPIYFVMNKILYAGSVHT